MKLSFLKAVNMYDLLSMRTTSSYYLKYLLNECNKHQQEVNELEASMQKSYLSLSGIKDLTDLLNITVDNCNHSHSSTHEIYKEIDDLYQYVRTGILPHYLKNETSFHKDPPQAQPSTKNENDKLTKLLKNFSNDSFLRTTSTSTSKNVKKKPFGLFESSFYNSPTLNKKKQTENLCYDYASLSKSRALPPPPPKYKPTSTSICVDG